MVTGRVLQFDHGRGYGFVAADDGGEDVFLHTSVFDGDPEELVPGAKVEFKVMAGDRGRKAFAAHLVDDEPDNDSGQPSRPVSPSQPLAAPRPVSPPPPALGPRPAPASSPVSSSGPTPLPASAQLKTAAPAPAPRAAAANGQTPDDEQMCDVLSPTEFGQELTELLLSNVSSLTGQQILEVRQSVLESAKKHGWVDM